MTQEALKLALEALELINIEFVCGNGSHHKKEDRHEWDEDCPITNRWRKAITAIKEALAEHAMRETQRLGQEIEQCQCTECQIKPHASDCAVHSEPAYPKGKCDCGAQPEQEPVCPDCKAKVLYECVACSCNNYPPQRTEQEPCGGCGGSGWVPRDPDIGTDQECFVCGGSGVYPKEPEQEPVAWPCLIAEADFSQDTVTLTMQCQDYKVSAGKHWLSTTPPQRTWVGLTEQQRNDIEDDCEMIIGKPAFDLIEATLKANNK